MSISTAIDIPHVTITDHKIGVHDNIQETNMSFELVYSGGGSCNPEILSGLKAIGFNIKPVSTYGVDGSTKEALLI